MNEEQWLETNNPLELIEYHAGSASERKLRLFACAACRRILHVMKHEGSRKAVEVSERYADGLSGAEDLLRAELIARDWAEVTERERKLGWNAARTAAVVVGLDARAATQRAGEAAADADLFREHFGNPFRPILISDAVRSWHDWTVVRLAQAAYDERTLPSGMLDNTRLVILADALEEAGCTEEQILTHLRSGNGHYRGCYVVDALLGKH
jgi:hypothetical protein